MNRLFMAVILFFSLPFYYVLGQDSIKVKKIKVLPVPAFGYSPETRTYVGAVSLFTFNFYADSLVRHSNAKVEFNYTWNRQIIVECGWNFFSKNEAWFSSGQIHYSRFPDFYYGIGADTQQEHQLTYNSNRFILHMYILKKIRPQFFTGLNIKHIQYRNVKPIGTGILSYPELVSTITYGIGYSLQKDSRNNLLSPTKGLYLFTNTTCNFSTAFYTTFSLDFRYYKTWRDRFTTAVRLMNSLNFGTLPFYDYAILGGDNLVRGYYYGRYREKKLSTLQLEFRFPVVWRFGLAAFGGLSYLYSGINDFAYNTGKPNYGLGIRFVVDKRDKINLRFDYARGENENSGFYVSFGESF